MYNTASITCWKCQSVWRPSPSHNCTICGASRQPPRFPTALDNRNAKKDRNRNKHPKMPVIPFTPPTKRQEEPDMPRPAIDPEKKLHNQINFTLNDIDLARLDQACGAVRVSRSNFARRVVMSYLDSRDARTHQNARR